VPTAANATQPGQPQPGHEVQSDDPAATSIICCSPTRRCRSRSCSPRGLNWWTVSLAYQYASSTQSLSIRGCREVSFCIQKACPQLPDTEPGLQFPREQPRSSEQPPGAANPPPGHSFPAPGGHQGSPVDISTAKFVFGGSIAETAGMVGHALATVRDREALWSEPHSTSCVLRRAPSVICLIDPKWIAFTQCDG
jgi:hypothetical protein